MYLLGTRVFVIIWHFWDLMLVSVNRCSKSLKIGFPFSIWVLVPYANCLYFSELYFGIQRRVKFGRFVGMKEQCMSFRHHNFFTSSSEISVRDWAVLFCSFHFSVWGDWISHIFLLEHNCVRKCLEFRVSIVCLVASLHKFTGSHDS